MKIHKLYIYSDGKEYYFKFKSGRDKKIVELKKINKHDLYVETTVDLDEKK